MRRLTSAFLAAPGALFAFVLLVAFLILAVIAPPIWGPAAMTQLPAQALQGMSADHWFGTDELGRDIFARTMVATRLSLVQPILAIAIGAGSGVFVGAIMFVLPRPIRSVVLAINEFLLSFPALLIAFSVAAVLGPGSTGAVVAIAIANYPFFARLTFALASNVASLDYIAAGRLLGLGPVRLTVRHILPNIAGPLVVNILLTLALNVLAFAGLSFLGIGTVRPEFDWGALMTTGIDRFFIDPIVALGPACFIVVAGLSIALLGDAFATMIGRPLRARKRRQGVETGTVQLPLASLVEPDEAQEDDALLQIQGLTVQYPSRDDDTLTTVVNGISLTVRRGEILGVVGESGSGKSQSSLAIAGLVRSPGIVHCERAVFGGAEIPLDNPRAAARALRGKVSMVFQNPLSSFNPAMRIERQLTEGVIANGMSRAAAERKARALLTRVQIPDVDRCLRSFPDQLSGGMRQRVMIAMALIGDPDLIIADEPTTALDVTVQREILDLIREVQDRDTAVLFISHDVAVVSELCSRAIVMRAGAVIEELDVRHLASARHPYTRSLIACTPDLDTPKDLPLLVHQDAVSAPKGTP